MLQRLCRLCLEKERALRSVANVLKSTMGKDAVTVAMLCHDEEEDNDGDRDCDDDGDDDGDDDEDDDDDVNGNTVMCRRA